MSAVGRRTLGELPPALVELARLWGVQPAYPDALGVERSASAEAVVALLRALGEAIDGPAEAAEAVRVRRLARAARPLEPVIVAWQGRHAAAELALPAGALGAVECRLEVEGGRRRVWSRRLDRLELAARRDSEGAAFEVRRLPLPADLPPGYHRLRLEHGGEAHEATVVAAPVRAWREEAEAVRRWGVFLPLYALHREQSWGVGDLSDLVALGEWAGGLGASAVGTLPILAGFFDQPYDPSPYAPASRLFWNELFVDPRRLPELEHVPEARALVEGGGLDAEIAALFAHEAGQQVDYRRAMALKRRVLEPLARALAGAGSGTALAGRREALAAFRAARPRLDDYAAFRAVGDRRREPWQLWPEPLRSGEVAAGDYDPESFDYHLYAQFVAAEQVAAVGEALAAAGSGLYLDLPLGVHPSSYDVWRQRPLFVGGVSAGAPPDLLFARGQDWGFRPLHPERQRLNGYRYLAASLAHHLEPAGLLRIDHVMQLHRLFCVPEGMSATEGLYLEYPAEELLAVVCLESHRGRAGIVGENLGTVPEYVDAALAEHGISGMFILQLELAAGGAPAPEAPLHRPLPADAVAALNTHDMPSFTAFLEGADIDDRLASGLIEPEQAEREATERALLRRELERRLGAPGGGLSAVVEAALAELAATESPLVLVNLEDLWGETEPQNVPGTTSFERPNWRRRSRLSLTAMAAEPRVAAALSRVDAARRGAAERARQALGERPEADPATAAASPISDDDLYLFNEGRHFRLWEKLGAHPHRVDGVDGTWFAVWAPGARRVSVVGDFNGWDPGRRPLAPRGRSGIWEGFVAVVGAGERYKFHVESRHGDHRADKADPFARRAEEPPKTASVLWSGSHPWGDDEWMARRGERAGPEAPMSVYELHLGSWRRVPEEGNRPLGYRELAAPLTEWIHREGFTHVELMPVTEHPFYGSWGYQITGYFAPTARYGAPEDLMALVDHLHRAGIGVILDWVPSHFPTDEHGLGYFDGSHLFEHSDPRLGFHPDWNSFIFDYGRPEVRSFLISNAVYWLEAFHADGLRVDAVASMLYRDYSRKSGEWTPNVHGGRENLEAIDLLRQLTAEVRRTVPGACLVAEESTSWPGVTRPAAEGGLGFAYKWDMGWMHDTLRYLGRDPIHRRYHHDELTFRSIYAEAERYVLALSHDEVVHGKRSLVSRMPGDDWQKRANLRLLFGYQWTLPGKKLLFMGCELGQGREWDHESSLDWHLLDQPEHAGIARWVADLNRAYRELPALHLGDHHPGGFVWVDADDAERSVLAYLRRGGPGTRPLLAVLNFTPVPRPGYRVGVPAAGRWREVLNGDAADYGGSGVGNQGEVEAAGRPHHGLPSSLEIHLPPLALVLFAGPAEPAAG